MTTRVALLGYPVGHSRSPAMHTAAFRELGMDWSYEAIAVEPERFEAVVRDLVEQGYAGANVTIPHKLLALEVADTASAVARAAGAANTLIFSDGRIAADNTDAAGFLAALRERAEPDAPRNMNALVLGAGGAARAVVHALLEAGAARVSVWNRHPERAQELVADLGDHAVGGNLRTVPEPEQGAADLIVNATSVGMAPSGAGEPDLEDFKELRLSADAFHDRQVMVDLAYRDGETALVREARVRGMRCADGLDVLVHQGAVSFGLWTGVRPPLKAMRDGARERTGSG
jgi:shikimate dehydrogenase